jgi:hypothetical protein
MGMDERDRAANARGRERRRRREAEQRTNGELFAYQEGIERAQRWDSVDGESARLQSSTAEAKARKRSGVSRRADALSPRHANFSLFSPSAGESARLLGLPLLLLPTGQSIRLDYHVVIRTVSP